VAGRRRRDAAAAGGGAARGTEWQRQRRDQQHALACPGAAAWPARSPTPDATVWPVAHGQRARQALAGVLLAVKFG